MTPYPDANFFTRLHVASALALQCDTFWSFDPKASKLARLEGMATRGK
jgi:hypothetical protein